MSVAEKLKCAFDDRVQIAISDTGQLKVVGNENTLQNYLPFLREHKPEVVALLLSDSELRLLSALAYATKELAISPRELRNALSQQDIDDWVNGKLSPEALHDFARSWVNQLEMKEGIKPTHYAHKALCNHCGPVWLFTPGTFDGCPWCWHRVEGRAIPRP